MQSPTISQSRLAQQLLELGVRRGGVLVVHCAFSKVKPVEDGPRGLIAALQAALGPEGTLVMPSMPDDAEVPFEPTKTPCLSLGVVANMFWQMPGVLRSHNPHAFAALGLHAKSITAEHSLTIPHGPDSPIGRVYELDGQVLLLGVEHDANTIIHLAENLAGVRYRRKKYLTLWVNGGRRRLDYAEVDHCCQNFKQVEDWLEAEHLQSTGQVGYAAARLMNAHEVVRVVTERLKRNETVFLHPLNVDAECDEARASLG